MLTSAGTQSCVNSRHWDNQPQLGRLMAQDVLPSWSHPWDEEGFGQGEGLYGIGLGCHRKSSPHITRGCRGQDCCWIRVVVVAPPLGEDPQSPILGGLKLPLSHPSQREEEEGIKAFQWLTLSLFLFSPTSSCASGVHHHGPEPGWLH